MLVGLLMRERGRPRTNYVDYIQKLTGMRTSELMQMSQDREAWRA